MRGKFWTRQKKSKYECSKHSGDSFFHKFSVAFTNKKPEAEMLSGFFV